MPIDLGVRIWRDAGPRRTPGGLPAQPAGDPPRSGRLLRDDRRTWTLPLAPSSRRCGRAGGRRYARWSIPPTTASPSASTGRWASRTSTGTACESRRSWPAQASQRATACRIWSACGDDRDPARGGLDTARSCRRRAKASCPRCTAERAAPGATFAAAYRFGSAHDPVGDERDKLIRYFPSREAGTFGRPARSRPPRPARSTEQMFDSRRPRRDRRSIGAGDRKRAVRQRLTEALSQREHEASATRCWRGADAELGRAARRRTPGGGRYPPPWCR